MVPHNVQHATPESLECEGFICPETTVRKLGLQRLQLTEGDSVWCEDDRSLNPDTDPAVYTFR